MGSGATAQMLLGEGEGDGVIGLGSTSMALATVRLVESEALLLAWDKSGSIWRMLRARQLEWFLKN